MYLDIMVWWWSGVESVRCGDRALQSDLVPLNRFDELVGQRLAEFVERLLTGEVFFPFDLDAGRFDDAHDCGGHFRPDAIARNQCDTMPHMNQSA